MIAPCYFIYYFRQYWALLSTFILFLGLTYLPEAQPRFAVLCLFQCFEEKEYQTESKWNEINWRSYFWKESHRIDLDSMSEDMGDSHDGGGRAHPPRRALLPRGAPVAPPTSSFHPYIPSYPKTSRTEDRSGVPPPQASIATKNLSGALPGSLSEGGSFTGGHLHHPGALHDKEGVVHPRG